MKAKGRNLYEVKDMGVQQLDLDHKSIAGPLIFDDISFLFFFILAYSYIVGQ